MKPNIGLINAFLRITCGFTLLSWAISRLVRRPGELLSLLIAMTGAMHIAEGYTRFCPLTYLFEEINRQRHHEHHHCCHPEHDVHHHHTDSANGTEGVNPS
ncbi:Protein of unknown function [Evansella caseinilytica]|uniref:Inner membrane protein YgaP-like transmembrane domain-containing protein n=1 Tax=Evansella caseinilytica TaxID=1503961 RepID=A0A1H3G311_9BACI|nr:DUF2892 domain-containing protein [Evansella caseinilytica]SDX96824.1 Protein of unknown function [Evansella caseinilytica]